MSRPLDVAFVWHMHQPYYRSASTGTFAMPWVRLHALKDYLDMIKAVADHPDLHQTFNLVPSLVEQLQEYDKGDFDDVYWRHTVKPADELDENERAFILERMCDRAEHPRAHSHPRYLELAHKRDALSTQGWQAAAKSFTTQELLDLQLWSNLAWCGAEALGREGLGALIERGREFREEDKQTLAVVQAAIISEVLPAYRDAASGGQIELTTSPFFHPILPLLCDTDLARVATPDLRLPPRRFAHPDDALEHLRTASAFHREVFGDTPRGVWCSEMAVGETVIPLLAETGFEWTISDESVLARSFSGVVRRTAGHHGKELEAPYWPYRLTRGSADMAIVFRDHTLSDLIGFTYRSWDSRDAAADLLARLRDLRRKLPISSAPLVVIALDGENAWEYYPNEGRDFLAHLYEGLSADDSLRCVTVSEHLAESPPRRELDWLHTGSWICADLTTWCGTDAHAAAWDLLERTRVLAQRKRQPDALRREGQAAVQGSGSAAGTWEAAWRNILIAEGSDWFWWFGEHHHTDLDSVWDAEFRARLQEVYRLLDEPVPPELHAPLAKTASPVKQTMPVGPVEAEIDGLVSRPDEWEAAGYLVPVAGDAMQPSTPVHVRQARFGWCQGQISLLVAVDSPSLREGLWIEVAAATDHQQEEPVLRLVLRENGSAEVSTLRPGLSPETVRTAWKDVIEISIPTDPDRAPCDDLWVLVLRVGIDETIAQELRSEGPLPPDVALP